MSAIRDFLRQRLEAGEWSIGQVLVRPDISLRHVMDAAREDLGIFTRPEDARELVKYDDAGNYRPLKTAPSLRRGWLVTLAGIDQLQQALDFIYPAALGTWVAREHGTLAVVSLRETLGRQSGMYRVTQLLTDEQAGGVVRQLCVEGCIRRRLWGIDGVDSASIESDRPLPILCAEACNLFVAACRPFAKQNLPQTEVPS